ncbi:crotonase/enoyl-CoA hydratase family protein [Marinicella sp. S1101]|uniref:crotonase/enoyl-CoA hydratase family protein n=1 Tax=Marinicella marina TaxID=2996016 RepID=UPI002260E4DF|nr:crotonase/enoyl-CoA hydratase family protein [Marinicella marina]MCX7552817.1 crotonase/enoyl-CoA hydratase family protein [Marinicella marina]MDJ1139874.1 crotonase/enoyl-CoA hydratase family protein [Marinicella marina]
MTELVTYSINNGIATITMDDGKSNVASPDFLDQLNAALDAAEKANAIVILTGRAEVFCAGFDLRVLRTGVNNAFKMLMGGFWLVHRMMSYPRPVIIACNGHAIALGVFILLTGDYRVGAEGDYKLVANEVQNGLTMPHCALALCQHRVNPSHLSRAMLLSEVFTPQAAIEAGFLDLTVSHDQVMPTAQKLAEKYAQLDDTAHQESKLRMRRSFLRQLKRAIKADRRGFVLQGVKRMFASKK